jgi:ribosomal protein S18 acetylase RimI-like enzyme
MEIRAAEMNDLEALTRLFELYRVFYECEPDPNAARSFLEERLTNGDSRIFCAFAGGTMLGFTQLYPSFSSSEMKRIWILNDLFVDPDERRRGVGGALLEAAREFGNATSSTYLSLETQTTNKTAQSLYESKGWERDREFYTYALTLP